MTPALPASSPPPNWVEANHPLGWLINRVLAVEPLRQLLFWQARRLIIRTAEGRGIAWRQRRELLQRAAEPLLVSTTNPAVAVPPYYRARFHAYDAGNLCWAAACEAEQATASMAGSFRLRATFSRPMRTAPCWVLWCFSKSGSSTPR